AVRLRPPGLERLPWTGARLGPAVGLVRSALWRRHLPSRLLRRVVGLAVGLDPGLLELGRLELRLGRRRLSDAAESGRGLDPGAVGLGERTVAVAGGLLDERARCAGRGARTAAVRAAVRSGVRRAAAAAAAVRAAADAGAAAGAAGRASAGAARARAAGAAARAARRAARRSLPLVDRTLASVAHVGLVELQRRDGAAAPEGDAARIRHRRGEAPVAALGEAAPLERALADVRPALEQDRPIAG